MRALTNIEAELLEVCSQPLSEQRGAFAGRIDEIRLPLYNLYNLGYIANKVTTATGERALRIHREYLKGKP